MPGGSGGRRNSPRASASAEPGWTWWKSAGLEGRLCWHDMDLSDASLSGMLPRPESQRLVDWLTDGAIIPKAFKWHWLHACFCRIPTWDTQSDVMKKLKKITAIWVLCPRLMDSLIFRLHLNSNQRPVSFLLEVTTLQTFLYQAGPSLNLCFVSTVFGSLYKRRWSWFEHLTWKVLFGHVRRQNCRYLFQTATLSDCIVLDWTHCVKNEKWDLERTSD